MSQISAVTVDAEGRLVSFIEGSFLVTVRRDAAGRPLVARAVSGGKAPLQSEFKYSAAGVLTGMVGNLTSSMISVLVGDGLRGGAPISAGGGGAVSSVAGRTGSVTLTKDDVGLSNVDNTPDASKPVSTAQATAIGSKQNTLVSGTNIKTVNGTSLLGSGDVVIVGGGGISQGTLDTAVAGLQAQIDNAAIAYDPVTLTGAGPHLLTAAAHANRLLICNHTAAMTLQLQTDAAGGFTKDDSINALQAGTGAVSITGGSATLQTVTGVTTTTLGQNRFIGAVRSAANTWTPTELTGGGSSATTYTRYSVDTYIKVARQGQAENMVPGSGVNTNGTTTARSIAATNELTRTSRFGLVGSAAAETEVGVGFWNTVYFDTTPYLLRATFGISDAISTGAKSAFGVFDTGQQAIGSGQQPDGTYGARAMVASRSSDSQFVFITNDESGAPTVTAINGGTGFPCNDPTVLYELTVEYHPTGPRRVIMTLNNLSSGLSSGAITFTTNIPSSTTQLYGILKRSSAANVAAPALDFNSAALGSFA